MSIVESPVLTLPGITVPHSSDSEDTHLYDLWQIPGTAPARIESVYMQADWPGGLDAEEQVLEIQLVSQADVIFDRQASPVLTGNPTKARYYCSWFRGANGDPSFGTAQTALDNTGAQSWFAMTLPDLVLGPGGIVRLGVYRQSDGGLSLVNLSQIMISYTFGGQGTAQTAALDPTPFLLPSESS